jgi:hypothetical protein
LDCAGNQHGNTRVCHMVMINLILIITISSRPSSRLTKPKKKTVRDVERKFAKKEDVVERRRNGNQRADLKEGVSSPSQKHKAPLPVTASGRKAPVHYLWAVRCGRCPFVSRVPECSGPDPILCGNQRLGSTSAMPVASKS